MGARAAAFVGGPRGWFFGTAPDATPVALPRPQQLPERNNKNIFVALAQRTSTRYHLSGKRNNKSFFVAFTAPSYGLFVPQCRLHNILHRRYAPARPRQRGSRRRSQATTLLYPVAASWPLNGAERSFRCPAPERARSVRCKVLLLS